MTNAKEKKKIVLWLIVLAILAAAAFTGMLDMESAFRASRYDKGTADYVNCPMTEEEYTAFWKELTTAREAAVHGFDDGGVFEGCMPVEVMARRGFDTLRYGPMTVSYTHLTLPTT